MNIKSNKSYGIVGYNIEDVNLNEMRQMAELKDKINDVLKSHAKDSKEKKYVNDDDLKLMSAILSVFTKDYESTKESAFDDYLKELAKQEKPQPKIPNGDDQLFG